jgi:hypothetical protein
VESSALDDVLDSGERAVAGASARAGAGPRSGASIGGLVGRFRGAAGGHAIASLDALVDRAQELARASGQSANAAAALVVEDLESASAALTARTAPLVPGCGVLVAVSGLAVKAEPSSNPPAEALVSLAVLFAVAGFAFLTRALFLYAGRRTVGLSPTIDDIAFARARLIRKYASANRGGLLAGIGLAFLIAGILAGVHITIH